MAESRNKKRAEIESIPSPHNAYIGFKRVIASADAPRLRKNSEKVIRSYFFREPGGQSRAAGLANSFRTEPTYLSTMPNSPSFFSSGASSTGHSMFASSVTVIRFPLI